MIVTSKKRGYPVAVKGVSRQGFLPLTGKGHKFIYNCVELPVAAVTSKTEANSRNSVLYHSAEE
jgi:hypothetical protein